MDAKNRSKNSTWTAQNEDKIDPENLENFLYPDFMDQLDPNDPLLKLAKQVLWHRFEEEFADFYSNAGRPAKPIRLMVGLLILKQLENLSDERHMEAWVRNSSIFLTAIPFPRFCGRLRKSEGFIPKLPSVTEDTGGKSRIDDTRILIPSRPKKSDTAYQRRKARMKFRRRASIEPVIGHIKHDHRMDRNYLKGAIGDAINLLMAATAFNFRKLIRAIALFLAFLFFARVKHGSCQNYLYLAA